MREGISRNEGPKNLDWAGNCFPPSMCGQPPTTATVQDCGRDHPFAHRYHTRGKSRLRFLWWAGCVVGLLASAAACGVCLVPGLSHFQCPFVACTIRQRYQSCFGVQGEGPGASGGRSDNNKIGHTMENIGCQIPGSLAFFCVFCQNRKTRPFDPMTTHLWVCLCADLWLILVDRLFGDLWLIFLEIVEWDAPTQLLAPSLVPHRCQKLLAVSRGFLVGQQQQLPCWGSLEGVAC